MERTIIIFTMSEFSCDFCDKVYKRKADLTRHINRKICGQIATPVAAKSTSALPGSELINPFKSCLNILRDGEGLTGEKALRNMTYLLILRLIEPHLGNEINLEECDYDLDYLGGNSADKRKKLLKLAHFSALAEEPEYNLPDILTTLWESILSVHPSTKNIFLGSKNFDIERASTFSKLIKKINEIDLTGIEHDVLGSAYEEVIQDIMTGKVLGQFFTPPLVKKIMIDLIQPQVNPDGTIATCCDPTMGTGGFLISYIKEIIKIAERDGIKLNWDFIERKGIYGKEIEPDTYQLAASNMIISSGHIFEDLVRGDSIREPIDRKFDNILANPPFGIKGLKYSGIHSTITAQYVPIKSDNAVSLFIQAIIYMLKIEGKCAIVLPDGQDLFSKTNITLIAVREYLLKTCDLREIIYLPSGVFTNTSIKTCIFYFVKKVEGTAVLIATTGKYKFVETYQTASVSFYEYEKGAKKLLIDVPIDRIAKNAYSLNFAEYMESATEAFASGITAKTLGEICKFLPKSKRLASYGNQTGKYPFYTSSQICSKYVDECDFNVPSIIIGSGGNANIKLDNNFSCSADNFILTTDNTVTLKYIYYYLLNNIEILQAGFTGVAIKHISKDFIAKIGIPIPSFEVQTEIVEYLDSNNALIKKLETEIENNKKEAKIFLGRVLKAGNDEDAEFVEDDLSE